MANPLRRFTFDLDLGRAAEALRHRAPDIVFNLVEAPGVKGRLIGRASCRERVLRLV